MSACLLGVRCRYDGESKHDRRLERALEGCEVVLVCPEVAGGLSIPHPPCEIVSSGPIRRVVDSDGRDVTRQFLEGARKTVSTVSEHGCDLCVLKSKSPSCGCHEVYDGTFSGSLAVGEGIAARALRLAGFRCVDETEACEEIERALGS